MTVAPPPPFDQWSESVAWEERLIRDGCSLATIADTLAALGRAVPLTRAAILFNRLRDEDRRDDALDRAQAQTTTLLERLYVFAVSYSTRRGRAMLLSDDSDMPYGDLLRRYLHQVRTLPPEGAEVSRAEVEYRVLEALHYDSIASGDSAQAIVTAKEMILLVTVARVPELLEKARRYYRSAIAQAGRYHEDLTERLRALQRMTPVDAAYQRERVGLAIAQLNVGDLDGALATTREEPVLPLHTAVVQAFRGHFSTVDVPLLEDKNIGWIARCLRGLAEVDAIPPWRGENRQAHALAALDAVRQEQWRAAPTDRPFIAWLEARCRLEAGEYGLARHTVNAVAHLESEDLLSRTLLAGLRLELALTDEAFQLQTVMQSEDEVRRIFDDARELRHGSAAGLGEVLTRWHPRPAAYMALCPNPVLELLPAAAAVLRCTRRAEVHGLILPPLTALDEVLRAFGLPPVQARLGSNAKFQRQRLMVRNSDMNYWRPIVPAAQLAIALLSVKTAFHRRTAERLVLEYGLAPEHVSGQFQGAVQGLLITLRERLDRLGFNVEEVVDEPAS